MVLPKLSVLCVIVHWKRFQQLLEFNEKSRQIDGDLQQALLRAPRDAYNELIHGYGCIKDAGFILIRQNISLARFPDCVDEETDMYRVYTKISELIKDPWDVLQKIPIHLGAQTIAITFRTKGCISTCKLQSLLLPYRKHIVISSLSGELAGFAKLDLLEQYLINFNVNYICTPICHPACGCQNWTARFSKLARNMDQFMKHCGYWSKYECEDLQERIANPSVENKFPANSGAAYIYSKILEGNKRCDNLHLNVQHVSRVVELQRDILLAMYKATNVKTAFFLAHKVIPGMPSSIHRDCAKGNLLLQGRYGCHIENDILVVHNNTYCITFVTLLGLDEVPLCHVKEGLGSLANSFVIASISTDMYYGDWRGYVRAYIDTHPITELDTTATTSSCAGPGNALHATLQPTEEDYDMFSFNHPLSNLLDVGQQLAPVIANWEVETDSSSETE